MSFDGPPPRSYDNYPRRIVRHTIHHSDPGPDHDSERVRTEDERLKRIEEQLEREVRRDEYERRHRERISASTERAKYQERMDRLERDRVQSIVEDERNRQEVFSREERIRREQIRLEKDREFLRREQEHAEELFKRQRAEDLSRQQQQHRMASKELELAEELYRIQRLEQDVERRKLSRKERRTNSGKTATESRPAKVERIQSSGLSAPTPEEPRSFLSRWILGSTPTGKTEATPSKTEQAPKIEASSKVEPVARPDKSEPPLKSALLDLEGYFLQPAQDSLIQKSVVALSDSIDQHVYNHYGDRAASPPADFFLRIVQIDAGVLRLPQGLTNKNSFRLAAIRRMIASALIRNISAKGDPSTTFMPKEVVSLLTMTPAQGTERCKLLTRYTAYSKSDSLLIICSSVWSVLGVASNCRQLATAWAEYRKPRIHRVQESASEGRIRSFAQTAVSHSKP